MPSLWGFVLAILGTILVLSILLLLCYQIVQKRRRERLQRRIESGEADLEFLGLNQMKVPREVLEQLPKYTYPDVSTPPDVLLTDNVRSNNLKFFSDGHGAITTSKKNQKKPTRMMNPTISKSPNRHPPPPQPLINTNANNQYPQAGPNPASAIPRLPAPSVSTTTSPGSRSSGRCRAGISSTRIVSIRS